MTRSRVAALFFVLGALGMLLAYLVLDLQGRGFKLPLGVVALSAGWLWIGFGLRGLSSSARFFAMGFCAALIGGGILAPLYVLLLFMVAPNQGPELLTSEESIAQMKRIAQFVGVTFPVVGIAAFHALRYLRSFEGRLEFAGADPDIEHAVLPHESIANVIVSAVIALVASFGALALTVRLKTESLPDFIKSEKALEREAIDAKYLNASVTAGAFFSADSRHVVIPPSEKHEEFLVLDLETGKLRRVAAGRHEFDSSIDVAPDASAIVSGSRWISLTDGNTRWLSSLPESDHLGFVSPNEFLAYDSKSQQIELIDLRSDRETYAHPLARDERGQTHEIAGYGRTSLWDRDASNDRVAPHNVSADRRAWSADRRKYLWVTRDRVLHILDVASGKVVERACDACRYNANPLLAPAGDALFFVTHARYGETGRDLAAARLFRIDFDEWRDVGFRGQPMFFGSDGAFVLLRQVGRDRLTFRDLSSASPREWVLPLPEQSKYTELRAGRVLEVRVAGRRGPDAHYALFAPPSSNAELKFVPLTPRVQFAELKETSADGRYLLLVAGATIEIVDIDALLSTGHASRAMHVLEDDALHIVETKPAEPSIHATRWVEREVEMPSSQTLAEEMRSTAPARTLAPPPRVEVRPRTDVVLKCVSPSGGLTFTQGACPAGTRQQEEPRKDSF